MLHLLPRPRTYGYCDGESHFQRLREFVRTNFSCELYRIREKKTKRPLTLIPKCQFAWTSVIPDLEAERKYYFTSAVGNDEELYGYRIEVRRSGFDPIIVHERSQLQKSRERQRDEKHLIEKAKGVDLALAARLLEDAFINNFERCILYTSDLDYLPLIESLKRMGKRVSVCGFKSGLSRNSPMLYVPDDFIDLEDIFSIEHFEVNQSSSDQTNQIENS